MLRLRRYRVFLAFAIIAVLAFIHFTGLHNWSSHPIAQTGKGTKQKDPHHEQQPPADVHIVADPHGFLPESTSTTTAQATSTSTLNHVTDQSVVSTASPSPTQPPVSSNGSVVPEGKKEVEKDPDILALEKMVVRWSKMPEDYPVASSNIITLPTGTPKKLPKVQFDFPKESPEVKKDREDKLAIIKDSFERSWTGYKNEAWGHDEILPVTGGSRDPFMGWGATLVDSLDTIWMMGMTEEFEEALEKVREIDFTVGNKHNIPVFETVIRYLGGLIGAYDISGGKYQVLIDKACELAEILIGVFDTPNRMPVTSYSWKPSSVSQTHKASSRTVLAELGSLTIEFTRLAQITKENKYYDAVARITDALELWQDNTTLPGLWPTVVDASGCIEEQDFSPKEAVRLSKDDPSVPNIAAPVQVPSNEKRDAPIVDPLLQDAELANYDSLPDTQNSEVLPEESDANATLPSGDEPSYPEDACLDAPFYSASNKFTLGAPADSTYEYLPKMHMLLGGLSDQYLNMYKKVRDASHKHLFFRPMIPDNRDILFHATITSTKERDDSLKFENKYEGTHLGCFAGGMFGIGAKMFGLDEDLDVALKLTDGCVWAYESTKTGIMPETFTLLPCKNLTGCEWNQTAYYDAIDPFAAERKARLDKFLENQAKIAEDSKTQKSSPTPISSSPAKMGDDESNPDEIDEKTGVEPVKRALPIQRSPPTPVKATTKKPPHPVKTPSTLSHAEYAEKLISEKRIPPGFVTIGSSKYILRPEAIESVFIMYRITGDESWRTKAWDMFTAIEGATQTQFGNSAINDVTSEAPFMKNEMESFWLGETLKYFYLIFSDSQLASLDDYVFNTEAHPHKIPVAV